MWTSGLCDTCVAKAISGQAYAFSRGLLTKGLSELVIVSAPLVVLFVSFPLQEVLVTISIMHIAAVLLRH